MCTNLYKHIRLAQPSDLFSIQEPTLPIAFLGGDERGEDEGRSDTIIIYTINRHEQTANLISMRRGTYDEIFECHMSHKINYAYGVTLLTV